MADGHGGIQTIAKTATSGLVDTYTITFADTTTSTFTVTNGRSISNMTSSKSGKVTTVTITYNDSTTSSFTVRDGEDVSSITEYWAVSTSGSSQPQSGWQTTPPSMTSTYKYLWHYTKYTYSDNSTTSTTPAVQGVYGDKGDTGNTGTSITSITKTGTSGLVDTYTITFSNGATTTFNVTNGSEIESITKTGTAGLVDTYTVTMGSGDTFTFTVTNGRSIVSFTQTSGTHAAGTIDVYTITYNDGDTSQIQVYNGANGTGAVSTVAGIGVSGAAGDVPLIIKDYGAPTTATVGQANQLYFDMTGGIMYICIANTGGTYDWRGMSSAVDSALSTTSANPVRNSVISNKVGVGSLSSDFNATDLTAAANELMSGKAQTSHATNAATYGKGTSTNYGHVKISDSLTDTTTAATGGIVPSMKAVSDLNTAINTIADNGIWLCVGDSFLVENPGNTSWAMCIATYLGKTYGTDVVISAKSGTGFSHAVDDVTFITLLNNAPIAEANRAKVSKVIFGGGTNDIFTATQTNLETDIPTAVKRAKQLFPNAQIYVADTECWINNTYVFAIRASLYEHYQNGCAMGGGLFLGAVGVGCKLDPTNKLGSDLMHPVLAGQQDIAKRILLAMSGIPYRGTKIAHTGNFWTFERNDIITVTWYINYTYTLPTAISSLVANGGNPIVVELNDFVVPETNSSDLGYFIGNIVANGVYLHCDMVIRPVATGFEVKPYILNSDGTNPTLTNVTKVQILGGQTLDLTAHCIG